MPSFQNNIKTLKYYFKMERKKYDTAVVFLYAIGKEKLLPAEFRKQIPYTTIANWRKADYSKYIGHEFRYFFDEAFQNIELNYRYARARKMLYGLSHAWNEMRQFIQPVFRRARDDKFFRSHILRSIAHLQEQIGMERTLKIFGLSRTRYHQWLLESRYSCSDSFLALCSRRHPHQLAFKEVRKIKRLLTCPEFDHWPVVSIAASALRTKELEASLYSWYKYARLLGITKKAIKHHRKRVGLVAKMPNEYFHVDSTYYPLIDNKKICISFVMDNYSKMVLGFYAAEELSFEVVKTAFANAMKTVEKHPHVRDSTLVADGGRENHHKKLNEFISNITGRKITKIRALKDIMFSNSPVEAIHKIMKGRYLRRHKFTSVEAILKYLEWAVMDYNTLRPHCAHRPRTPHEVYFDIPLDFDIRIRMKESMRKRVHHNKNVKCMQCTTFKQQINCEKPCEIS